MIKKLPILLLMLNFSMNAQEPLFDASSSISSYGYVYSPSGEEYYNIIDGDIETKFLDFSYSDGLGFTVDMNGYQTVATSMDFTTANDSPERDPTIFEILGSNDGTYFTTITTGDIYCDPERFYTTSYTFDNTEGYSYYRFIFSEQCNTIEAMIQIAEVQLFGTALGREDFLKANSLIEMYPNPSKGNFVISSKGNLAIENVHITDAMGKEIKNIDFQASSTQEISMEGAASGVYFVKIDTGESSIVKKMVIQ